MRPIIVNKEYLMEQFEQAIRFEQQKDNVWKMLEEMMELASRGEIPQDRLRSFVVELESHCAGILAVLEGIRGGRKSDDAV